MREPGLPTVTRVGVVLVVLETVVVLLEVEVELEEDELDELDVLDVLPAREDVPEEPDTPVTETTGVPVGRVPLVAGTVTTTVLLPDLTTVPPWLPDPVLPLPEPVLPLPEPVLPLPLPEPVLPLPELPEPVDTGVLETGVGGVTTGTVGVVTGVVPPPELPLPEPVPLPEPAPLPLPEPVLVGVWVGREPATGCEIVAELEWCEAGWPAVGLPTCASRVLRLLATAAGTPAAPPRGLTTLTGASPWDAWEPALGCAVSVCVAGPPMPPSLGHPL